MIGKTNQQRKQIAIIKNIANRGYFDNWTPEQVLKRQIVILLEEACELMQAANWPDTPEFDYLLTLALRTGQAAKHVFTERELWADVTVQPGEVERLRPEKADVTVVLTALHHFVNDVTGEQANIFDDAITKSAGDVQRGTSYRDNGR